MNDSQLAINITAIDVFFEINLILHSDNRGWFKENYQKQKMEELGLPAFTIVQNNISFNEQAGVTRGLHAEPWNKFISVANGRVFGVWVDLRKGAGFGRMYSLEITPRLAVYVPRGVANGYQTLEPNTAYTYLVNEHWTKDASYTSVNLADPDLAINWPISLDNAILSEKDTHHPMLKDITPLDL
jgi:dTDP-4-dehydrorhamnose 3,5-epimerase